MSAALVNLPPSIETDRVFARPYTQDDLDAFVLFMTDPEVNYYMDNVTLCKDEAGDLFDKIMHIYQNPPKTPFYIWAIALKSHCIGHMELKKTKHTSKGELEIVYLLDKKYWRKGIVSELIRKVVDFSATIDQKVIATVDKGNLASIRLLEKIGISRKYELPGDNRVWKIIL